jgi:hypothetical protein
MDQILIHRHSHCEIIAILSVLPASFITVATDLEEALPLLALTLIDKNLLTVVM